MIKKLLLSLVAIIAVSTISVSARDSYARDASVLPKSAQTVLSDNFKAKVSIVKIDKDFGRIKDYEVILTDGTEIKFDKGGNWTEIEVNKSGAVPSKLVPKEITDHVKKYQSGSRIIGIEKERHGYDVELSNGVKMKFNRQGTFLRYDD